MARPMANDPPFAALNHFTGDLGIPSESDFPRIGISRVGLPRQVTFNCNLGGARHLDWRISSTERTIWVRLRRSDQLTTVQQLCPQLWKRYRDQFVTACWSSSSQSGHPLGDHSAGGGAV